jgi:hypothetical protein
MKTFFTLLFSFLFICLKAQIAFQKIYSTGNYSIMGNGYCINNEGEYMIAGDRFPGVGIAGTATLMKLDNAGNVIWNRSYPGLNGFISIAQTQDGGYIISGYSDSLLDDQDAIMLKTDSTGNPQWCKLIPLYGSFDFPSDLIQSPDGGFLFAGLGFNSATYEGLAFILKTDQSGNLQWNKIITSTTSGPIDASQLTLTNDGGVLVTGAYTINSDSKLLMMKINSSGNISWSRCYGTNFRGRVSRLTNDGGFITCGLGQSINIEDGALIMKTDSVGNVQWAKVYNDKVTLLPDLIITNGGDYVLGKTSGASTNDSASIILIKTNPQGDTIWTRSLKTDSMLGYTGDRLHSLLQTSDNGFLLGGHVDNNSTLFKGIYLVKTDADGNSGCNQTYYPVFSESITPAFDTNITVSNGITMMDISFPDTTFPITVNTLCFDVGVQELQSNLSFEVYPNPGINSITIHVGKSSDDELNLEINDMMGRKILQQKISSGVTEMVDVSSLGNGIYIIQINGRNDSGIRYFSKQ